MPRPLRKLVACTLLLQVALVGSLGTGLHGLLGCEHEANGRCVSACCVASTPSEARPACADCIYCRRGTGGQDAPATERSVATVSPAGCDGCAVCDLLAQYHSVTPFQLDPLAIELASGEAALQRQNAAVAATIRLALSRGPPAV